MKRMRKALTEILERGDGERELLAFLKENPVLLLETPMSFLGHPTIVIAEFPLGNQFKADFAIISVYSGAFEIKLIEVEPPKEKIYTRKKVLAKRANMAFEQVNSWRDYIKKHRSETLETVDRYGKEKDLYRGPRDSLTCTAGLSIFDPNVHVDFSYAIIMGRRDDLTGERLGRKAAFKEDAKIELITCDRLFHATDKMDASPEIYT